MSHQYKKETYNIDSPQYWGSYRGYEVRFRGDEFWFYGVDMGAKYHLFRGEVGRPNKVIIKMAGASGWAGRGDTAYNPPRYKIGYFEEDSRGYCFTEVHEIEFTREHMKRAKEEAIRLWEELPEVPVKPVRPEPEPVKEPTLTWQEYIDKAVELEHCLPVYSKIIESKPEFLKSMATQQYVYGVKDNLFDRYTRKALRALWDRGDLAGVFEEETK
jgi:hypothetical protein